MLSSNLFIVATPLGNLEDLTFRAKRTLETVDLVACEDTRRTQVLLNHYGIRTPMVSFHSHSGTAKTERIVETLKKGENVALVSDAGTPGISDPGFVLIREALKNGVSVVPIPGPSAVVTALCASGLPTDKFLYLGFLPVKKGRQAVFGAIAAAPQTVVFYESPHRLLKTLEELGGRLKKDRPVVVAKELTKIHETYYRGTAANIAQKLPAGKPKGEYVVLVGPE